VACQVGEDAQVADKFVTLKKGTQIFIRKIQGKSLKISILWAASSHDMALLFFVITIVLLLFNIILISVVSACMLYYCNMVM